jgi:hypothetical protein
LNFATVFFFSFFNVHFLAKFDQKIEKLVEITLEKTKEIPKFPQFLCQKLVKFLKENKKALLGKC